MKRLVEAQKDALRASTIGQSYALDGCPAFDLMYVGDEDSCKIEITAGGEVTSIIGDLGSEAADPNFTIGATPGTIDTNNAAADTFGELAAFINSLTDYRFRLHAHPDDSSDDTLDALSAAQAKWPAYVTGLIDSSAALYHIHSFCTRKWPPLCSGQLPSNINAEDMMGHKIQLDELYFTGVNGSNWAPTVEIYNIQGRSVDSNVITVGFGSITSGNEFTLIPANANYKIVSLEGHRLLVKILNSTYGFTSITAEQAYAHRV